MIISKKKGERLDFIYDKKALEHFIIQQRSTKSKPKIGAQIVIIDRKQLSKLVNAMKIADDLVYDKEISEKDID